MTDDRDWVYEGTPPAAGLYVVLVGWSPTLARWSDRDNRWFDGYRLIDSKHVCGFYPVPAPVMPERHRVE